jgi:hypothetical protein
MIGKKLLVILLFFITISVSVIILDTAHANIITSDLNRPNFNLNGTQKLNNNELLTQKVAGNKTYNDISFINNIHTNTTTPAITINTVCYITRVDFNFTGNISGAMRNPNNYQGNYIINVNFTVCNETAYFQSSVADCNRISTYVFNFSYYKNVSSPKLSISFTQFYTFTSCLSHIYNFNSTILFTPNTFNIPVVNINNPGCFVPTCGNDTSGIWTYVSDYNQNVAVFNSHTILNSKEYLLELTNTSKFNITVNNVKYDHPSHIYIALYNGSYSINYSNSTINNSFTISILGQNIIVNMSNIINTNINIILLVYLSFVILAFMFFSKYFYSAFVVYVLYGILFTFIGFKLQIEFFNTGLILVIITLLMGIFAYKVVME